MTTIRGFARLSDGAIYPNATFTFVRSPRSVVAQVNSVVVPKTVTVTSDQGGAVLFDILPGTYQGTESATGITFGFSVPQADAYFQDCISAASVIPWPDAVQSAIDARDDAIDAASVIQGFPTMSAFNTWAASATPVQGQTVTVAGLPVSYLNPGPSFLDAPGWCPPGTVSMRYFGAEGNSEITGTDVSSAFEDARDYLMSIEYSGTQGRRALHIPGGQYRLTRNIDWTEDFTTLLGDGPGPRGTLIHVDHDSGPTFTFSAPDPTTSAIVAPVVRGIGFRKFTLSTGAYAIRMVRALDAKLHSIQTQELWGGFQIEGGQGIRIFDHQHVYGQYAGNTFTPGVSTSVAGSFGWKFREGPVSTNLVPSNVMFSQVDIRSTSQSRPWLACGIDLGSVDGLMGSAMHIGSCGGLGGIYFNPQVSTLSPYGSKCTWITGNIDLDGGNKYGMYFAKIASSDILEYANRAAFPGTGATGKRYLAQDTKTFYSWGGSSYARADTPNYGNVHLSGLYSRPYKNHIYAEEGAEVSSINISATMVNAGDNGLELLGGSNYTVRGKITGSGVNLTTGNRGAIVLDGDVTYFDADVNMDKVEGDGETQLTGVEVRAARVDHVNIRGTAYGLDNPVVDPHSYDYSTDIGYKTYDVKSHKETGFNIAVSTDSVQAQAYHRYIELDSGFTGTIKGMVRRFPGAIRSIKITADGQNFEHGVGSTTFSLAGGVDSVGAMGDVYTFQYMGGPTSRGWQEIGRAATPAVTIAGEQSVAGDKTFTNFISLGSAPTLTIASGVITATSSYHLMDTEGAAATDDLDTINGGTEGVILILSSANSTRDITVKNATGNIFCGSDRVLNTTGDKITLIKRGSQWHMTAFADN